MVVEILAPGAARPVQVDRRAMMACLPREVRLPERAGRLAVVAVMLVRGLTCSLRVVSVPFWPNMSGAIAS